MHISPGPANREGRQKLDWQNGISANKYTQDLISVTVVFMLLIFFLCVSKFLKYKSYYNPKMRDSSSLPSQPHCPNQRSLDDECLPGQCRHLVVAYHLAVAALTLRFSRWRESESEGERARARARARESKREQERARESERESAIYTPTQSANPLFSPPSQTTGDQPKAEPGDGGRPNVLRSTARHQAQSHLQQPTADR